ncbi:UreF-domain-containing protein [Ustulina deusta]|nr:UreF-domain-containing protein [Ustulina deusta]
MGEVSAGYDESTLENEIAKLESQLAEARRRLNTKRRAAAKTTDASPRQTPSTTSGTTTPPLPTPTLGSTRAMPDPSHHYLLLLSDSALPLGAFAFSSGLESYLAHARSPSSQPPSKPSFASFLPLSLSSYASTTLPFVLRAHRDPDLVAELDDALDASIICAVGRRASVAQGRALLSIWEKSLAPSSAVSAGARTALEGFSAALRASTSTSTFTSTTPSARKKAGYCGKEEEGGEEEEEEAAAAATVDVDEEDALLPPPVSAHLAPLFGAVAQLLGLTLRQTAYVFLFSHAKALVSAAVRASMFGPYQAQKILAGGELQVLIADMVEREWDVRVEDAAQSVPVMDLWIGRHEMLYSRIFNS